MRMPFGKYRGLALSAVPRPYLRWLAGQDLHGRLKKEVAEALSHEPALIRLDKWFYWMQRCHGTDIGMMASVNKWYRIWRKRLM